MDLAGLMEESPSCKGSLLDADDDDPAKGVVNFVKDDPDVSLSVVKPRKKVNAGIFDLGTENPPKSDLENVFSNDKHIRNEAPPPKWKAGMNIPLDTKGRVGNNRPTESNNTNIGFVPPLPPHVEQTGGFLPPANQPPRKKKEELEKKPLINEPELAPKKSQLKRRRSDRLRRRIPKTQIPVKSGDKSCIIGCLIMIQICCCLCCGFVISAFIGFVSYFCAMRTTNKKSKKCGCYSMLFGLSNLCLQVLVTMCMFLLLLLSPLLSVVFIPCAIFLGIICCPFICCLGILCFPVIVVVAVLMFCFGVVFLVILVVVFVILLVVFLCCGGCFLVLAVIVCSGCGVCLAPFLVLFVFLFCFVLTLPASFPIVVMVVYGTGINSYCMM